MPQLEPYVVLVVEDEPLIRMMAADAFADEGYDVVEAFNADEAINILERRGDISLVFTDIEMPGQHNGLALMRLIRERWQPVRVILASGRVRVEPDRLPTGVRFFSKPYDPSHVIAHSNNILD